MMLIMVFVGFGDLTGCNYWPLLIRSKILSTGSCSNFVITDCRLGGGALFVCDLEIHRTSNFLLGINAARQV
jgi:hypothetical protein